MRGISKSIKAAVGEAWLTESGSLTMQGLLGQIFDPPVMNCNGVKFVLNAGPFQNNGASQWYASVPIGSSGQLMKIALDSGSNFIWVTSTLCGTDGCLHYGGGQYNPANSTSFRWINQAQQSQGFGPWGSMIVELGQDYIGMPPRTAPFNANWPYTPIYLSKSYVGSQFEQLDWDGGLGLPSGSAYADPNIPPIFATMLNMGLIDPAMPYMSFSTNQATGTGSAWMGGYDINAFDPLSGIFMRWSPYLALAGTEYIWTTAMAQMLVGDEVVASNVLLALDSGSSQFKGDDGIMQRTLALVNVQQPPSVTLKVGAHVDGSSATIVVPPSVYNVQIQAGQQQGETLAQFQPLGLTDLVLVGSVLMDQLYTIFEYNATLAGNEYTLSPVGMWLFNKVDGPKLIQSRSARPAELGRRKVRRT